VRGVGLSLSPHCSGLPPFRDGGQQHQHVILKCHQTLLRVAGSTGHSTAPETSLPTAPQVRVKLAHLIPMETSAQEDPKDRCLTLLLKLSFPESLTADSGKERTRGIQERLCLTQLCVPPPRWQQCRTVALRPWSAGNGHVTGEVHFVSSAGVLGEEVSNGPGPWTESGAGWERRQEQCCSGKESALQRMAGRFPYLPSNTDSLSNSLLPAAVPARSCFSGAKSLPCQCL